MLRKKCSFNIFPVILLIICLLYVYYLHETVDQQRISKLKTLENVELNCDPVINGTDNQKLFSKIAQWEFHYEDAESEIYQSLSSTDKFCETIDKLFVFPQEASSQEEKEYPLAFGLVIYKELIQVLLQLSVFYQPQNLYCIKLDMESNWHFKQVMKKLRECYPNIHAYDGVESGWGSFGILENVYSCFYYLTTQNHDWKYYQYLSGSDAPMRTNYEMVKIFKALNETVNTDIELYEKNRFKTRERITPPFPLYKSSMSVAIPRASANAMIRSKKITKLMKYLKKTWIPDESFWTTALGSPQLIKIPGAVRAKDIIWFRNNFKLPPPDRYTVDHVGTNYIGRYQIWPWHKKCLGILINFSCVFGIGDVEEIVTRPELVAHKFYIRYQPAALMCLLKEIRSRSRSKKEFNAKSYTELPTVEMSKGKNIMELTHPDWLTQSSFFNPDIYRYDLSAVV